MYRIYKNGVLPPFLNQFNSFYPLAGLGFVLGFLFVCLIDCVGLFVLILLELILYQCCKRKKKKTNKTTHQLILRVLFLIYLTLHYPFRNRSVEQIQLGGTSGGYHDQLHNQNKSYTFVVQLNTERNKCILLNAPIWFRILQRDNCNRILHYDTFNFKSKRKFPYSSSTKIFVASSSHSYRQASSPWSSWMSGFLKGWDKIPTSMERNA